MFSNIGGKIKTLAQVVCWIGIVICVILGAIFIIQDEKNGWVGPVIIICGSLLSWVGSFMTYGFGQLVENSEILTSQKENNFIPNKELTDKINFIYALKEEGLITEEEYYKKKDELQVE